MRISNSARFGGAMAFGAVAAASASVLLLADAPALAKAGKAAKVGRIDTPLGLQGTRGAGGRIGVIFNLVDETRTKTDVDVQYGYDRNGDGLISNGTEPPDPNTGLPYPDEYQTATEDRLDTRDTRKNKKPQLFTTAGDIGAAQQYIWNSTADIPSDRFLTLEYKLTPQGRQVPDPDNPGSFLFATGPSGDPIFAGVKVRVRAFRNVSQGKGRTTKVAGDWVYSQPFALNNNNPPSMTLDSVDSNQISTPTASDEAVLIHWSVYDKDSEDLNGNGVLDIPQGEDISGDGVLQDERVGVAFDYHRVAPSENPASMTPAQLAALTWLPCTRVPGVGDTDSLDARPGVTPPATGPLAGLASAPPGVGRKWTFAWNSVADAGTVYAKYIFRGRPFDVKREQGAFSYFKTPVQLDNWKIFNPGGAGFPIASLSGPRVGHTTTRIQGTVNATDALDRGDDNNLNGFQSIVVAGGASSAGGGGVTDVDLMSINTVTAETSTSALIHHLFATGRAYHTATALDDGRILFAGGFDSTGINPLTSTEVYDPKTQAITAGPDLHFARAKHAAVKLASGDVAIFGGVGAGGAVLGSCELIQYQPYADTFGAAIAPTTWTVSVLPNLATAQQSPTATLLPDQMVLVTDGIDGSGAAVQAAQLLNPLSAGSNPATPQLKSPVFIGISSMLEARKYGMATAMLDGNVLFSGGAGKTSLEVFNWKSRTFEPVVNSLTGAAAAMPVARAQHVAPLLGDGTVLLAGGSADPDAATPSVTGKADVVRISPRSAGLWNATFQTVNGDLTLARRQSRAAVIDNGRVFIAGGSVASSVTATVETYTPANGVNFAPKARTTLPSSQQSWLYGAPIYFRLTDPETDRATVQVQFNDRSVAGDHIWHACSPQPDTIGGDVAETTADLATVLTDDLSLVIDPVVHNTVGDHAYIWAMNLDVPRPALGASVGPYNVRVIPYGAIRGVAGESIPLTVLYNTRVLPTVMPFENYADNRPDLGKPAGTPTAVQAGDIRIVVHLRDLDGGGTGTNGDAASCLYEYAVDKNSDGQIKSDDAEGWTKCSSKGAAVGHAASANPQVGLQTYFDPYTASDPQFGSRPANKGWTFFDWDSVRDLGTPATSFSNIWVRVTPFDADAGFQRVVRNVTGQPAVLTVVKHPDALWLISWRPRYSNNKLLTPINDPIDVTFNGQVEPASVTTTTFPVYRGTTTAAQILGKYAVVNNANNTATVTFYPDPQNLGSGTITPAQTATPNTVLYANDDYSFRFAGYDPLVNVDPQSGTTLRPLGQTVVGGQYSTYRLVQAPPINVAGTDANYKFHTAAAGVYADDGAPVVNQTQTPAPLPAAGTILRNQGVSGAPITFTFTQGLDPSTVKSPNITATLVNNASNPVYINGVQQPARASVVPGRWTVTNSQVSNGTSVSSSAVVSFTPVFQMPPSSTLRFSTNSGLKAINGRSVPVGTFDYTVEAYTRVANSVTLEPFTNTSQNDTTITNAAWGTDGCVPGTLTGGSSGVSVGTPLGGSALTVASGGTTTLTLATNDYTTITVAKGGTLVLASTSGAMTVRATGDISIAGTVTFKGQDGVHGMHGNMTYPYMYMGASYPNAAPTSAPARLGGAGKNGGGNGGTSISCFSGDSSGSSVGRRAGTDGSAATGTTINYGQGGQIPTETSTSTSARYYYGAGGGAGGGNAFAGLAGGRACTQFTASSGYGAASVPGAAFNDAFLSSGMVGGGGGGGGACVNYYPGFYSYGYFEGGAGGAGAGAVTFVSNGVFSLTATGLITGRGGNGGQSSHYCGSGGAGAGGTLRIVSFGGATALPAVLDGVIDLRGGRGGSKGYGQLETMFYTNATSEKSPRYGGDGAPGRLVVIAPNYATADEFRVYGQMYLKSIASLPTQTTVPTASSPPFGLDGSVTTTTYNYGATTILHYTSLNVASGATIDLIGTVPVQIYVDTSATISGTLRINGNSTTSSSTANNGTLVQNFNGQSTFPNGATTTYVGGSHAGSIYYAGMVGNGGGGNGGSGDGGANASGREGTNGTGPQSSFGVHNMNPSTGWYQSYYFYSGDTGGTGAANATDGEDGWAVYAQGAAYNYLGAFQDTATTGTVSSSGVGATVSNTAGTPNFPKRIGLATTDPTAIAITNLSSFAGAGGGGGNAAGDTYGYYEGSGGSAGGGGGALGIVSPTVTVTGEIDARGGDGQTPGAAYYWYAWAYAHSGGGGASGGTVYIAGNTINIGAVTPTTGTGGATFDLRGGMGGGWRSQNQSAGLQGYPEYMSTGAFGGSGGYGRLVVAYTNRALLNSNRSIDNRWGMEQTGIDTTSNTYKSMGGTARFYCPGIVSTPVPATARSKWYDLKSASPILTSFTLGTAVNATYTFRAEGAQSLPNSLGSAAGTWGSNYTANTGDPDVSNTSGLFVPTTSPILQGFRFLRFDLSFSRTTPATGAPVQFDNISAVYTSDL